MQYMDPIYNIRSGRWKDHGIGSNGASSGCRDSTVDSLNYIQTGHCHWSKKIFKSIRISVRPWDQTAGMFNPFPASTARREVFVGTCCTTTVQMHTPLRQQQMSLPSTGGSWFFVHLLLQATSPSALPRYHHHGWLSIQNQFPFFSFSFQLLPIPQHQKAAARN